MDIPLGAKINAEIEADATSVAKGVKVTDLSSMPKCDNWTWGRGHRPACWE